MEVLELKEKKRKVKDVNSLIKIHPFSDEDAFYYKKEGRANIKTKNMAYNTNYDIVVDGKLLQSNRQQPCFSNLTGASSDLYRRTYLINPKHKNKQVIAYALSEDINLKVYEIRKWIKLMKTLNLPFKFKELYNYSLNYRGYGYAPDCRLVPNQYFAKQKVYAIIINYDDYTSVEQFKILLYLFRYIYEGNLFEVVRNVIKYKETYKGEFDFMKVFFFIDSFTERVSYAHVINWYLFTNMSTKKFIEYINSYNDSKHEYQNVLMDRINEHFNYYKTKVNYITSYGYEANRTYNNVIYEGLVKEYKVIDYTKSIEENLKSLIDKVKNDKNSLYLTAKANVELLGLEINEVINTKPDKYSDLNDIEHEYLEANEAYIDEYDEDEYDYDF